MSLDIYLCKRWTVTWDWVIETEDSEEEVYSDNITHNLWEMADKAWLYDALWNPIEKWYTRASQLIPILESWLKELEDHHRKYKQYNPSNWWGSYDWLCDFVRSYLEACKEYPYAFISISK